ncbi:Rrf2 family transcriptional regulator, partial [Arthrospira platensis SPKY1]|nr:Rrf2 family transcriptional regulator [Arthrospira platensis SPKY1]
VYLAEKAPEKSLTGLKEIADAIDSPPPYTAKILNTLVRAKLLTSGRGPHGGFQLAKDPEQLRLIHIVDAIEGKGRFENCLLGNEMCSDGRPCACHEHFHHVRVELLRTFHNTRLTDLRDTQLSQPQFASLVGV